jgi:deferrochelatase/peroxidase EfeB
VPPTGPAARPGASGCGSRWTIGSPGRSPPAAHVRVASPDAPGRSGERLLRRGDNVVDGIDPRTGQLDAGLVVLADQRDPRRQFIPLQRRLAADDGLNEYLRHTGSAVVCCPPGIAPGGVVGETLLGPG